ncbi:Glycosyl Hydrolase Family 16 [Abortiporus biennis]
MYPTLPLTLFSLLSVSTATPAGPSLSFRPRYWGAGIFSLLSLVNPVRSASLDSRLSNLETGVNGSTFIWTIDDTYSGPTFFDEWDFFTGPDPTHGTVNYTDRDTAYSQNLVYVTPNNKVIMKGDNTTSLPAGQNRNSVRISSKKIYNTGLFILDLDHAPWGCGVWPAWWTVNGQAWPYQGEIDILEGVHDNSHNQVTWHTGPNCSLTPTANFTGSLIDVNGQPNLNCDSTSGNAGCGITEWSRASYGPDFDAAGGGVFAMKWDEMGIAVYSFYRAAVPKDILANQPSPSLWGTPVAVLEPDSCDPIANFVNHSIIFDITFCGDWAGNSYATSGCPGTCSDRLMDPTNFVNASWTINNLKVYKKQVISGRISAASNYRSQLAEDAFKIFSPLLLLVLLAFTL